MWISFKEKNIFEFFLHTARVMEVVVKSTRIRDYNAVRFYVKANEANECSVRNQQRRGGGRGNTDARRWW